MEARFTIRKKFVVNGKEYGSLAELPEALREAVEQANASGGPSHTRGKITINGQEFESADAIPPDLRPLVDGVMKEIEAAGAAPAALPAPAATVRVEGYPAFAAEPDGTGSLLPRWLTVAIAVAAAAAVYYFFIAR